MIELNNFSSKLLFATIRICGQKSDGSQSVGTAFFFHFQIDDHRFLPVLITNKHVVEGCKWGKFFVHQGIKDKYGQPFPANTSYEILLPNFENNWIGCPGDIDLCAMPFEQLRQQELARGKEVFYVPLDETLIPTSEDISQLLAAEEIIMAGYPIGLWDDQNNLPILRRGITASHPAYDFQGQPIGLADIASFPGSSGSPILVINEGTFWTPNGVGVGSRAILLGVLFAGPQFTANGEIKVVNVPTTAIPIAQIDIPMHLGYYIKAKELVTLKKHIFSLLEIGPNPLNP